MSLVLPLSCFYGFFTLILFSEVNNVRFNVLWKLELPRALILDPFDQFDVHFLPENRVDGSIQLLSSFPAKIIRLRFEYFSLSEDVCNQVFHLSVTHLDVILAEVS